MSKVKEVREQVKNNIISEKNTDGFLMGRVNDYVTEMEDIANNACKRIDQDI